MITQAPARWRVLVVDDEIGPRESLRMLLKPNYQIRTADSARAGFREIETFEPDVVILDIKMPEIDGLEALRRIKRLDSSIEVVMITAYASLETVRLALSHGAFEYLIKPFSRRDLEDVVQRAVSRREANLGTQGRVAALVNEMRSLTMKTFALEEAARREATQQSLRVAQLSILRELARTVVRQLHLEEVTRSITEQLLRTLGYDRVIISVDTALPEEETSPFLVSCRIEDAEGLLGHLVVDNRLSGRAIEAPERELLEMLSEYLAIAVRNSRLYGEITTTKRSLEQVIACAGDAIIAVDGHDRVDGWNPAAERIFGLTAAEAIGRPITEFLAAGPYIDAKRLLHGGADRHAFEFTGPLLGGREASLAVTLSALHDRQGGFGRLIAIVRDTTTQREVEAQLHQFEKLRALGQLAGGIAHDFNNLLQAILGYAQLLKENPGRADLTERSLRVIEAAALDGSETVRSIQQFARLRPEEEFVPVDLNRVIHDAVAITRPRWEESMAHESRRLMLQLDLGIIASINGRPAALTESITNLILNAIDAMPRGGTLTIATRPGPHDTVTVSVSDTGIGMPSSVQRRIFEPFFSTKGEGGSGLGLSMAYSIVKRHGGDIEVSSELGHGTAFTLSFPIAREPLAPEPETPPVYARRHARVLLVDDNDQVRGALTDLLGSLGHEVDAAPSGTEALAAYAPGRYDVVVTNLGMAGMSGWDLAERVRSVDSRVAMFLITGWGLREEEHERLVKLNIFRCLFKPVRPVDLDAAIQAALARRP